MVTAQADLHSFVFAYIKCRVSHEEADYFVINHSIIANLFLIERGPFSPMQRILCSLVTNSFKNPIPRDDNSTTI